VPAGDAPQGVCYNPIDNRVYCTNYSSNNVTVIDCTADTAVATVPVCTGPWPILHSPVNNKVYVAGYSSDSVTVIDGATNAVLATIGVGDGPSDMCCNPQQNRVYTADYRGWTISVLHDSIPSGVEEGVELQASSSKPGPTIVRGVLMLPRDMTETAEVSDRVPRPVLLDAAGRKVLDLHPGANDVSRLAPGVYFIHQASGVMGDASSTTRVVITD